MSRRRYPPNADSLRRNALRCSALREAGGRLSIRQRFTRGFTLIELLVVMAIVATLLSIAAPRYFDHLDRARDNSLRQSLTVMRDSIDKFAADNGRYPEVLNELVTKRYLRAIPADPITESAATWVTVPPPDDPIGGVYDVRSGAGEPYERW